MSAPSFKSVFNATVVLNTAATMLTAAAPVIQGRISRIPASDAGRWQETLEGLPHDFYHSAAYHRFCEETGAGEAFLAIYREGARRLLWPYLMRPVSGFGCDDLRDITSVYGYAGPLAGRGQDPAFLNRAFSALTDLWRSDRAVSVFSRLHPLLQNDRLFSATGPPRLQGQTVSIDLTESPLDTWRDYRKSLRYDIRAARSSGIPVGEDTTLRHLGGFAALYRETMSRNGADPSYFFDHGYFRRLFERLGASAHLMTACWQGRLIGGAIFVGWRDVVHYHFSAAAADSLHHSPAKLLLDEIRLWGQARHYRVFHLGGGRGSMADSLFSFKAGFSPRRHPFYTWQSVLEPNIYQELSSMRRRDALASGHLCAESFFPYYRSPCPLAATPALRQ